MNSGTSPVAAVTQPAMSCQSESCMHGPPGMHIPVLPSQAMYEREIDYVVVLAWNFAAPIMQNHAAFRERGGHFIVPLPAVEVH